MSDLEHEKYTIADVKNGRTPSDYVLAMFRKAYQAGYKQDSEQDEHLILTLAWNHIADELRINVPMLRFQVTDQMTFISAMEASNVSWEGIFRKYAPQAANAYQLQQPILRKRSRSLSSSATAIDDYPRPRKSARQLWRGTRSHRRERMATHDGFYIWWN